MDIRVYGFNLVAWVWLDEALVAFSSPGYPFLPGGPGVARCSLHWEYFAVFGAVEGLSGVLSASFACSLFREASGASVSAAGSAYVVFLLFVCWRSLSYRMMAVAVAVLRDVMCPCMGILMVVSHRSRRVGLICRSSPPRRRAMGPVRRSS